MKKTILSLGEVLNKNEQQKINGGARPSLCTTGECYSLGSNIIVGNTSNGNPCGIIFGSNICKGVMNNGSCCIS